MVSTRLIVKNTKTKIVGRFPRVEVGEICTFRYKNAYFMKQKMGGRHWDGNRSLFSLAYDTFPTGLIARVILVLKEHDIDFVLDDQRKIYESIRYNPISGLREYQEEIVKKALNRSLMKIPFPRAVLKFDTGSGKTIIAVSLIQSLSRHGPVLFIVDSNDLLEQTREQFASLLPQLSTTIFGGGVKDLSGKIVISTVQSLYSKYKNKDREMLLYIKKVKALFVDEIHDFKSANRYKLFMSIPAFARYYLSATPFMHPTKAKNEDLLVVASCGELLSDRNIESATRKKLVEDNYLVPMTVLIMSIKKTRDKTLYNSKYPLAIRTCIEEDVDYHNLVMKCCKKLIKMKRNILILVLRIKQGNNLSKVMTENGISNVFLAGSSPQEERNSIKAEFRKGEKNFVIIATKIYDKGIDIPVIDAIILAGPVKAYHRLKQRVGRGVRIAEGKRNCIIVDFFDSRNKYLYNHSGERFAYYRDESYTDIKVVSSKWLTT